MPRASNEKKAEAEKLYNKGMKLIDIAKKLEVPEGTVRSWKNREKWKEKSSKKTDATLQKMIRKVMQRCKKGNEVDSPEIETQKAGKAVLLLSAIRTQKRMVLIRKYIGMLWMKMK